jgi:hypothetical protein
MVFQVVYPGEQDFQEISAMVNPIRSRYVIPEHPGATRQDTAFVGITDRTAMSGCRQIMADGLVWSMQTVMDRLTGTGVFLFKFDVNLLLY